MNRIAFLVCLLFGLLSLTASAGTATAQLPPANASGRVLGYDPESTLLTINARLGRQSFLVTSTTLILLNNHTATVNDIRANDQVRVTYNYQTSEAITVQLTRTARRRGTVATSTNNTLGLRLGRTAVINLTVNALSEVSLEGITVQDRSVLIGQRATAVYEPGTFLLLSLKARSRFTRGTIAAVDATALTMTVNVPRERSFTVDPAATVYRNGEVVPLATLVAGDTVRIAYVKDRSGLRVLALAARGSDTPAEPEEGAAGSGGR